MKKLLLAACTLLVLTPAVSSAVTLWDQSNWNTNGEGSLNLSSTSCSAISGNTKLHTACDVSFPQPVAINSIQIYETPGNVESATQAYLWIAPKTGSLPTESSSLVNAAGNLVPISISYEINGSEVAVVVTASALNITLPAGDYWVSLTPRHSRGLFPYAVHRVTTGPVVGAPTCAISACTVNTDWLVPLAPASWDYAIKILGDLPVPTKASSWGHIKSIYR